MSHERSAFFIDVMRCGQIKTSVLSTFINRRCSSCDNPVKTQEQGSKESKERFRCLRTVGSLKPC